MLSPDEIQEQEKICVEQAQKQAQNTAKFTEDKAQLGLERNEEGIWEFHGRIQGESRAHLSTLHRGVRMVMSKVRENYWVPQLRKLVKKVLSKCYGCKKFRARPANAPPSELLPSAEPNKLRRCQPRTQALSSMRRKDPGWGWSREHPEI